MGTSKGVADPSHSQSLANERLDLKKLQAPEKLSTAIATMDVPPSMMH
jgi:hypothetical protein